MKLALAQMLVEGGEADRNLTRAEARVAESAREGAHVVLLPEALDSGWTHPSARQLAQPIPEGESFRRLSVAARKNATWVCTGLVERDGDQLFNSAVLIDPAGQLRLKHRKINELDIAHDLYSLGRRDELATCDTPFGRIGTHICADAFADGQWISRELCNQGAQVILSPCAWAVEADHDNEAEPYGDLWRDNYRPVCRDYDVSIAGCSCIGNIGDGPWKGRNCIGNSIVMGPRGDELISGPFGVAADTLLFVEIPPALPA